ncbi:MAG: biotin--[acetyl-CoA-carboxylase] ligase [Ferruginibacter sp.]
MQGSPLFTILDRVDSTNNYAMAKVHAGLASHGMAWLAREQTAGRGQRGRHWESAPGQNIAMSMVVNPLLLGGQEPFYLSALVALACCDLLEKYAGESIYVKWPNDLYWRDRKAAGILIENKYRGQQWTHAVVGIGINVNQASFGDGLKNPVSLKNISGKEYDVEKIARELHELLLIRIAAADATSFAEKIGLYNKKLYKRNEWVYLEKEGETLQVKIEGVNEKGRLQVSGESRQEFDFGEVSWVGGDMS